MAKPVKRLRYFDGLFLREEEFNDEQEHYTRLRRLHNRYLHSNGIVYGLEVEPGGSADSVSVTKGMALDRYEDGDIGDSLSREIILRDAEEVSLQQYDPSDEVWLWIAYGESQADADAGGNPTRYEEIPQIIHGTTMPTGDANIILARIVMPAGSITESDIFDTDGSSNPIRKLAGFQGGSVSTDTLILTDDDFGTDPPTLDGFYWSGTDDRGVKFNSDRTQFSGDVEIDETLTVTQDATFSANVSAGGTMSVTGNTTLSGNAGIGGTLTIQGSVSVDEVSDDDTMADASATAVPTERAVREYVESLLVGSITAFAMQEADLPDGWVVCDGREISRTTYARLFGKISTNYGTGDGSTTFNVPDLQGEFIRGLDATAGNDPDSPRAVGSSQADAFQGHWHDHPHEMFWNDGSPNNVASSNQITMNNEINAVRDPSSDGVNGTPRTSSETRPRNVAMLYCIKT